MHNSVDVADVFRITRIYTAFGKRFDSNYYFDGEYHNFWEIVTVADGEIGVTAGSDIYMLKKGQAIIHEPMEFHRLWSEGSTCPKIIVFSFCADNMPAYASKIFEISDLGVPERILQEIRQSFEVGSYDLMNIKTNEGLRYQLAVKMLEMYLLDTISQKLGETNLLKSRTAQNYATIVNVLESNIQKNLSIGDVAKKCNMSEINVKKTFSRYAGMGVMAYFNHIKITAAITMLKSGKSVQETADLLGFSNQNYFSTVFKRVTGNSPTHYK